MQSMINRRKKKSTSKLDNNFNIAEKRIRKLEQEMSIMSNVVLTGRDMGNIVKRSNMYLNWSSNKKRRKWRLC